MVRIVDSNMRRTQGYIFLHLYNFPNPQFLAKCLTSNSLSFGKILNANILYFSNSAHQDGGGLGHFLTASVSSFHGPDIYIRKLVAAGHKVGIVTQVETTASKKVSSNPAKDILERKLTGVYTATTLIGNDLNLANCEKRDHCYNYMKNQSKNQIHGILKIILKQK